MSATADSEILAITIEGVGDINGSYWWANSTHLFDDLATLDPDDLIRAGTLLLWPQSISASLRFTPGSRPSLGSQTFTLRRTDEVRQWLWSDPAVAAKATADLTVTGTSLVLDTGGLSGVLWWGREAIKLGAEAPAKTYDITGGRGALGTFARAHGSTITDDAELFARNHVPLGRVVKFYGIPKDATSFPQARLIFAGTLRGINAPHAGTVTLDVDSAEGLVRGTQLMRKQWRGRIYLPGEDAPLPFDFQGVDQVTQPDAGANVTGQKSMAMMVDGKALVVADYHLINGKANGRIYRTPAYLGGSPPVPNTTAEMPLWEVHTTAPGAPSNEDTPDEGTLPLSTLPHILLLQLLLTTKDGGNHADYDLGIENLAGEVPAALVDVSAILNWGRKVAGAELDSFHIGLKGEPEDLYDLIQDRILAPFGAYLTANKSGLLTVIMLSDAVVYGSALTLSQDEVVGAPQQDRQLSRAFDRVVVTFNEVPGVGPTTIDSTDEIDYQRNPRGDRDKVEINAGGISERLRAYRLATAQIERWHKPIPSVKLKTKTTSNFDKGDVVEVTHEFIFATDAEGTLGVTDAPMQVTARTENLGEDDHSINYEFLNVGALYNKSGWIAPSAEVTAWTGASNKVTVDHDIFSADSDDPINPDWEGFALNDYIQICDQYGTVRPGASAIKIIGVTGGGNIFELHGSYAPGPGDEPVAGDIVRVAAHGSASTTQKADWVFKSDDNNELSGGADPNLYQY